MSINQVDDEVDEDEVVEVDDLVAQIKIQIKIQQVMY
jgi:hypothetical protein